jgi:hypothetical protein
MTSYQPLKDAAAIQHLDWVFLCKVRLLAFDEQSPNGRRVEDWCENPANLWVTFHSLQNCGVHSLEMCADHFRRLFLDPNRSRVCIKCSARRFISARPII